MAALLLTRAGARAPAPTPCPTGRYLVVPGDGILVPGASLDRDALSLVRGGATTVQIDSGCPSASARAKTKRRGTTLVAHWAACGTLSKVRLSARIAPDCQTMAGVLRARKTPPHRFDAVLSACGDHVVDVAAGEECEDGGCGVGANCTLCRCTTPGGSTTSTSSSTITTSTASGSTSTTSGSTSTTGSVSTTTTSSTAASTTTTSDPGTPPPDPATVVPEPDATVIEDFAGASRFLVASGIQTGVAPNALDDRRLTVVRGHVTGRAMEPIAGVVVSVAGHPELGHTRTRIDGMFDLVVNGGGALAIDYAESGYLPVQRTIDAPWRESVMVPDVVLVPVDPTVAVMTLPTAAMAVLQASPQQDDDGSRRATLLVPAGTTAEMVLPDDSVVPLSTMHVHATEFTVGTTGPAAMPGDLPPASGYTYALEYTVDEAVAAGATTVRFNQPVFHYSENFLGFPVGTPVPAGDYDAARAVWMPSNDGRVLKVLGATAGRADLDVDGSDTPASAGALAALGVTDEERAQLAALYAPGATLWRVPMAHFSPKDWNWARKAPDDAQPPNGKPPKDPDKKPEDPCKRRGSLIGCYDQTLGEDVPVTGTPFRLHYASDRVPGRTAGSTIDVPVTDASVPASLRRAEFEMTVAGRRFAQTFPPLPNQTAHFAWDGIDAYGRRLQGPQVARGVVTFVYPAVYGWPSTYGGGMGRAFGAAASISAPILGQNRAALEVTISREITLSIGAPLDARGLGLGGWSLDVHHVLDPLSGKVLLGTGDEQDLGADGQIDNAAGNGDTGSSSDEIPAQQASLYLPTGVATGPDGTIYVTDSGHCRIRSITADGIIHRVAGTTCGAPPGDGGPAIDAGLGSNLVGLAVGPDGSLYVSEFTDGDVRRIGPDGIIHRVAGTGTPGYSGDGGPADAAELQSPFGLAVGPDGSLFIADGGNQRIRRVAPDGIIYTVAGNGTPTTTGDGGPAAAATVSYPREMAIARDGTLYFSASSAIRRITPDGVISTFFNGGGFPPSGDGGPIENASGSAEGLAIDLDGTSLFFADYNVVRRVGADGIVRTVAGGAQTCQTSGCGDGGPGTAAYVGIVYGLAMSPTGHLYMADRLVSRVRALTIRRTTPWIGDTIVVPSEDGRLAYAFDASGRHLQTVDAMTGGLRLQFGYDPHGNLASVTDEAGNTTTIEHDATGMPTGITAPGGQHTSFTLNPDGYLASIVDPGDHTVACTYGTGAARGLLATFTDARGGMHAFTYDAAGRLLVDADPAGGSQTLARTDVADGQIVSVSTALGQTDSYAIHFMADGAVQRVHTDPTGATTTALYRSDASRRITYPDGTIIDLTQRPDPRWLMAAPIVGGMSIVTPGGTTSTMTSTRTATLATAGNPLSLTSEVSTVVLNGKTYTSVFDGATRTHTLTTPSGAKRSSTVDGTGRTVAVQGDVLGGTAALLLAYDAKGRLHAITHGTRSWTWEYDAGNRPTARTDALGGRLEFGYDAADRRTQVKLPGGRVVALGRDGNGNVEQVTPPAGQTHLVTYDPVDRLNGYTAPGAASWSAMFDADGRPASVTLPAGRGYTRTYDAKGRFATLADPDATLAVGYAGVDPSQVTSLTRTPAAGPAHTLTLGFDGTLPTSIESSDPAAGLFDLTYGADGSLRPTSIAFTSGVDGVTTNHTYDVDRRLATFGPFTITRGGPGGAATAIADGTLAAAYTYDVLGRAVTRAISVGGTPVHTLDLVFDAAGRVTQRTDTLAGASHVTSYTYDADSQLATVDRDGVVVEEYTYDARGNRLTRRLNGGATESASYDAQDRLLARGGTTYQLDDAGFLAARGGDTFTYDSLGQLLGAVIGGQPVAYAYDGIRRRVARTDAAGTRRYYYGNPDDDFELTAYRDAAGVLTYCHYDRGRLFALQRSGAWYYVGTDQIGSPRVVVDAAGVVQKTITYDAFGVANDSDPSFELPIGFAGGLADPSTGLVRFGLRDYEPASGRWVTRDPVLFVGGQANLYAYVGNDPVYLRDPSGTFSVEGSVYDGLGVGAKLSITSKGISACVETGGGFGSSLEVEPFGDLDGNTFGLKGEASGRLGLLRGKTEGELNLQTKDFGIGVGECGPELKGETKVCVGELCGGGDGPKRTVHEADFDLKRGGHGPLTDIGEGFEAKAVVRLCQALIF